MSSKSVQSQHKAFVASVSGIPLYFCPLIFAGLLRYYLALLCRGIACMWARLIYEYWSLMLEVWDASNSLCLDMMQMRASRGDCAVLSPQFYKFGSMIPSILSTFCFLLFPTSPRSNILATSFIFLRKKQKTTKNKKQKCQLLTLLRSPTTQRYVLSWWASRPEARVSSPARVSEPVIL